MKSATIAFVNVVALRRRLAGQVTLVALSAGLCLASFGIADNAEQVSNTGILQATANRSITVSRLIERTDSPLLNKQTTSELAALPGVVSVEPRAQVSFGYKDANVPGVLLYATLVRPSLAPPITRSVRPSVFPLGPREAVLPERADGTDLTGLLGRQLHVQTITRTGNGTGTGAQDDITVVGLYDPKWQIDGPAAAYVETETVLRWSAALAGVAEDDYTQLIGYDYITVVAAEADLVPELLADIQDAGYAAISVQQQLSALPTALTLIHLASRALLAVLALVALVGTLTVTGTLVRQRTREIGILKATGFRNRTVFLIILMEALFAAVASVIIGGAIGIAGSWALASGLRGSEELAAYLPDSLLLPSAATLLLVAALTVAVVALGALRPAMRASRMDPSDAMRDW